MESIYVVLWVIIVTCVDQCGGRIGHIYAGKLYPNFEACQNSASHAQAEHDKRLAAAKKQSPNGAYFIYRYDCNEAKIPLVNFKNALDTKK